ncbi:MAG: response regulator transcription factor [Gemmatimonadales bacterium]|nr:response regulator transcription factor [Gemmatimonadales bacterium]
MSKPTVIIVDDEPLVRAALRRFIQARADVELAGEAADGVEALELVERVHPAVVLLDVQMPLLDGLAVARALPLPRPEVVFVTAFDRYAIEAFDVHAVDYVLKPFDDARLGRALDRAMARRGSAEVGDRLERLLAAVAPRFLTRFLVRVGARLQVVAVADVEWFEAADNYVKAHLGGEVRTIRASLRELEEGLDPAEFVRVHRTALVRLGAIVEVVPRPSGDADLKLASGTLVPLSRQLRSEVIRRIGREG